jgi:hypothetical protein
MSEESKYLGPRGTHGTASKFDPGVWGPGTQFVSFKLGFTMSFFGKKKKDSKQQRVIRQFAISKTGGEIDGTTVCGCCLITHNSYC